MILESRTRGQPLVALILVLGAWIGARGLVWEKALHTMDEMAAGSAAQDEGVGVAARAMPDGAATTGKGAYFSAI